MRQDNQKYCFSCGAIIDSKAQHCPSCGVFQPDTAFQNRSFNARWLSALLLCLFFGVFGVHRFYLNRVGSGILMLITFGGLGIWYLIDLIILIVGGFRDGYGKIVKPNIE
jgi:TM2 domain-containing membrane protein YozV